MACGSQPHITWPKLELQRVRGKVPRRNEKYEQKINKKNNLKSFKKKKGLKFFLKKLQDFREILPIYVSKPKFLNNNSACNYSLK